MDGALLASVALLALVLSPFLAHIVGRLAYRAFRVAPGHARLVMPTLAAGGSAARLSAVEGRVLAALKDGASGVDPRALAARLSLDPTMVDAVFARMRDLIPCRLRVTASGRLLHDFAAQDVAKLRRQRALAWPRRAGLFLLMVLANGGATWPLFMSVAIGTLTLGEMCGKSKSEEDMIAVGLTGLLLIALVVGLALGIGWLFDKIMSPIAQGPYIKDPPVKPDKKPVKSRKTYRPSTATPDSSHTGRGSSIPSPQGFLAFVVIAALIAIISAALVGIVVWLRGLWRSLRKEDEEVSPSEWVRNRRPPDWLERFLPTNDLVMRTVRALGRLALGRPADPGILSRALARARERGGVVSSLDVMLQEGLDRDQAVAVTARIGAEWGAQMTALGAGDLLAELPQDALREAPKAQEIPGPECLLGTDGAPVNIPGLTAMHLSGLARLAAGSFLAGVACAFYVGGRLDESLPLWLGILLLFSVILAMGTAGLAAVARYAAKASAAAGVLRDVRRATFSAVRQALSTGANEVDAERLVSELKEQVRRVWPSLEESGIRAEVQVAIEDMGLSPNPAEPESSVFRLAPLRERMEELGTRTFAQVDDDRVVFDTGSAV